MPLKRETIRVAANEGKLAEWDKTVLVGKGQLNSAILGRRNKKAPHECEAFLQIFFAFVRQEPRLT